MYRRYHFRMIENDFYADNASKINEKARADRLSQLARLEEEIKQQFIADIRDKKHTDNSRRRARNREPPRKEQQKYAHEEYAGWIRQAKHIKDSKQHSDGELPSELDALATKLTDTSRSLAKEDEPDFDYRALFVDWYSFQINPARALVE